MRQSPSRLYKVAVLAGDSSFATYQELLCLQVAAQLIECGLASACELQPLLSVVLLRQRLGGRCLARGNRLLVTSVSNAICKRTIWNTV